MSDPIEELRKEVNKSLHKAGVLLVSDIRKGLNVAQPYVRRGSAFRGLEPSRPGEYPRKLSGQLLKSVAYVVDEAQMILTVGTNQRHGKFLEFGTKHMKPRPWLLRTFEAAKDKIASLFGAK